MNNIENWSLKNVEMIKSNENVKTQADQNNDDESDFDSDDENDNSPKSNNCISNSIISFRLAFMNVLKQVNFLF